jgi:hypothetical protein
MDVGSVEDCPAYCETLVGYVDGACRQNPNQCTQIINGIYIGNIPEQIRY